MTRMALAALVPVALGLAILASPACILPSISTGTDAGTAAASDDDSGTTATTPAVQGASCTAITSSISLCAYISACPSLALGAPVFPNCGFRIHGTAIDPECFCMNEYLCPIGSPTTCAEAAAVMSGDTNYDSVCEKAVTGGGCTDLAATTSSTGSTSSACQACIDSCGNVPTCIDSCGC